ncbi:hypothetical protein ACHQM5_022923 [Ranunculus cassubicifolius]
MRELEQVLESSEGHKEWLKHLQWTYSEPSLVHFFIKPLMPGFQQKLVIPRKFVTNFREKLSDVVVLRGPNGNSWKVSVTEAGDDTFLGHGWEDFVKAHSLEKYYVLVFRYDELESCFDVLVFDRNQCEKEIDGSPTVNPDIPRVYLFYKDLIQGQEKLYFPNKFVRIFGEKLPEKVLLKGPKNTVWNIGISKTDHRMLLERGWGEFVKYYTLDVSDLLLFRYDEWDECFYVVVFDTTACEKKGCASAQTSADPGKSDADTAKSGSKLKYNRYFCSHRRHVTAEEKRNAVLSAQAVKLTKPNFIAVMKPCHVYKRFFLTLPKDVVRNYLSQKPGFAYLRAPPSMRTWTVSILYKEHGRNGGISGGWAGFVMDNNLEEGDVCVFEILNIREENPNSDYVVDMNVSIHRVVDEVIPVTIRKAK